jgi:hypothetical protein
MKRYLNWLQRPFEMKKEEQFYFYLILSHVAIGMMDFCFLYGKIIWLLYLYFGNVCDEDPKQKS